jgi:hypothetical protein
MAVEVEAAPGRKSELLTREQYSRIKLNHLRYTRYHWGPYGLEDGSRIK